MPLRIFSQSECHWASAPRCLDISRFSVVHSFRECRIFAERMRHRRAKGLTPPRSEEWKRADAQESRIGFSLLALLVFGVLSIGSAVAQQKPVADRLMEIEQSTIQPPVGVGRPIPTWWDVRVKGTALVEGRFEFVVRHDGNVLATLTTEELALTGPQQRIRVVLPPVDDPLGIDQLQVDAVFRGRRFTEGLGRHVVRVAKVSSRTFVALTSISRISPKRSIQRDQVLKRLAFESLSVADLDEKVQTVFAALEPNDLPQEPLAYCAYDLVVLFGPEFRALKKPHLEALTTWVRAGGSVYVEPTGVLEPYHVEFLRGLTATDERGLVFQADSKGRLIPGTIWEDDRVFTTKIGLGRAVLRVEEEESESKPDFESETWRRAVATLWQLRHEHVEAVVKQGRLAPVISPHFKLLQDTGSLPKGTILGVDGGLTGTSVVSIDSNADGLSDHKIVVNEGMVQAGGGGGNSLGLKLLTSTSELLERLMPNGVRMVPLWLLGFMLLSFVVVIGPVDYLGLGMLKARKYTWATFPAATILVTALTVWISNSYMSTAEARRGLVLCDIGDDDSVVRTNRFELLFLSASRAVQTDIKKGLFSPLATTTAMDALYQQYGQYGVAVTQRGLRSGIDAPGGHRSPPHLTGRIPIEYTATQYVAKWTPQLNRLFSLPLSSNTGATDEPRVDWKTLVEGQITLSSLDGHAISSELSARVRTQFGTDAAVACFGPRGRWAFDRTALWQSNGQSSVDLSMMSQQQIQQQWVQQAYQRQLQAPQMQSYTNAQLPADVEQQAGLFRWLYQNSVAVPRGLFGLVSGIAPKGGPDLDDLPIYDPTDTTHALLIVIVPRGDDLIIYRKLVKCGE